MNTSNFKIHYNNIFTFTRQNNWLRLSISNRGWGNGYIALPAGHSWYGKHYDELDAELDVHGGWTYSNEEDHHGKTYWVFGFDTAHHGDTLVGWPEERVVNEIENAVPFFQFNSI